MKIPFNKPYLTGNETDYINKAVFENKHISGNGEYTKKCQLFFEQRYKFRKTLLTTSCTDALEMTAMLMNIKEGDEVIIPSYTFVSTALAFVRQGATVIFADSRNDSPGIDEDKIEDLITSKTKAIIVVHYAGIACNMDKVMQIATKHNLFVVEDAAQAIDSYYKGKPLGGIGHFGVFSFHETKNIQCGEGGLLIINDEKYINRAEIIWEKGTNRSEFFRGQVNKYGWVDVGSSFLPADIVAAFLYAQLENIEDIQTKRINIWNRYYENLKILQDKGLIKLPVIPDYATNNAHMFFIIIENIDVRTKLINKLKENNILSVFHYLSLHKSPYYKDKYNGLDLPLSNMYEEHLLRLPLYYELSDSQVDTVCDLIKEFYL